MKVPSSFAGRANIVAILVVVVVVFSLFPGCSEPTAGLENSGSAPENKTSPGANVQPVADRDDRSTTEAASEPKWISMFDGKSLKGWKVTGFGGQEEDVSVKDGRLLLEVGSADMTGVTTTRDDVPRMNYEVSLEAMRVDGTDFFCGMTFPVGKDFCSLILGGWSGSTCGLSSIDGMDASENETTSNRSFENGRWYRVRLRVTPKKIEAWIDDEQIIDQDITDRRISVRFEVELSEPFGFATYQTTAALRKIRLRKLTERDAAKQPVPAE